MAQTFRALVIDRNRKIRVQTSLGRSHVCFGFRHVAFQTMAGCPSDRYVDGRQIEFAREICSGKRFGGNCKVLKVRGG